MAFDISSLLRDVAKPPRLTDPRATGFSKSTIEFVFDNLMVQLEKMHPQHDLLWQITTPELVEDETTRRNLFNFRANCLDKVRDLFHDDTYGRILPKAINFEQPALDIVCRKIVEHFFPEKIVTLEWLKNKISESLIRNNIRESSPAGIAMINSANDIFDTIQKNRYRAIAFPVLGYDLTDTEFQEFFITNHNLIKNTLNNIYAQFYPDDESYDPEP